MIKRVPKPIILSALGLVIALGGGWMYSDLPGDKPDPSTETEENTGGEAKKESESSANMFRSFLIIREEDEGLVAVFTDINGDIYTDEKGRSSFTYNRLGGDVRTTEKIIESEYSFEHGEDEFIQLDSVETDGNVTIAERVSRKMIFPALDGSRAIYVYLAGSSEDGQIRREDGSLDPKKALRRIERYVESPYEEIYEREVISERRG